MTGKIACRLGVYLCAKWNAHSRVLSQAGDRRTAFSIVLVGNQIAEYEREDHQTPALLEVRILADSVSGQAGELAATLDGRVGGQERPRAVVGGQGRWGVAVIFLRTVGVAVQGDFADVVSGAKGVGRAGCLMSLGLPRGW
jgi:hypothetical protein